MKPVKLLMRLFLTVAIAVLVTASTYAAKPTLVFSIAQGYPNVPGYDVDLVANYSTTNNVAPAGYPVVTGDAAITNMIAVLKRYEASGYPTCALINPLTMDKVKLNLVLTKLQANGINFAFDIVSSDSLIGHNGSLPGNIGQGVTCPGTNITTDEQPTNRTATGMALFNDYPFAGNNGVDGIKYYINAYPNLVGFRIHEPEVIFYEYMKKYPNSDYWNVLYAIEQFVITAGKNNKWMQYNSSIWDRHPQTTFWPASDTSTAPANSIVAAKNTARWLTDKYKVADSTNNYTATIIYPSYATNDGYNTSRLTNLNLTRWRNLVNTTALPSATNGFALSCQSWMTQARDLPTNIFYQEPYMPYSYLTDFVNDALIGTNPAIIQFESCKYFFNSTGTATLNNNAIAYISFGFGRVSSEGSGLAYQDFPRDFATCPDNAQLRGGFQSFKFQNNYYSNQNYNRRYTNYQVPMDTSWQIIPPTILP